MSNATIADTLEIETARRELIAAEEGLRRGRQGGSPRSELSSELDQYVKANRRYLESLHRAFSGSPGSATTGPDLDELARNIRDLWTDKQRVVSATATLVGKNKDFQQMHNALLKHIDQSWKVLQTLYVFLGGDIADLHRK